MANGNPTEQTNNYREQTVGKFLAKKDYICTICNLAYNRREDRTMPKEEYILHYNHRERTIGVIHEKCKEEYRRRLRTALVPESEIEAIVNKTIDYKGQ